MANKVYQKWAENLMGFTANNNPTTGNVSVDLVRSSTHGYVSADTVVSVFTAVATSAAYLATKTFTDGIFKSVGTVTFPAVTAGTACDALVIYINTGVRGTSPLMAYLDTGVTGLPVVPNGGDITITWDATGIFKLTVV